MASIFIHKYAASVLVLAYATAYGQEIIHLDMKKCIDMAKEKSSASQIAETQYRRSYWEYMRYKAGKLPSVYLQTVPIQYTSSFIKRYDYGNNIDIYRQQQFLGSSASIDISQNIPFTGGTLSLSSSLEYIRNTGVSQGNQFAGTPFIVSYSQPLFGFNQMKWDNRTEPLKYDIATQEYLYMQECISVEAIDYFFNLAIAQIEMNIADNIFLSCDSMYNAGIERYKIASISDADMMSLEADHINAENDKSQAESNLHEAELALKYFLKIDSKKQIKLKIPKMEDCEYYHIDAERAMFLMKLYNPDIMTLKQNVVEAELELDRTRKATGIDASLSVSIGFNKAAEKIKDAYTKPPRQEMVNISMSIPIIDWGAGKSRKKIAENNLALAELTGEQSKKDIELELRKTVAEYNRYGVIINKTIKSVRLASQSYDIYKTRFISGKEDYSTVESARNRLMNAQRLYQQCLHGYFKSWYKIRMLTLYDFKNNRKISHEFPDTSI